MGSIQDDKAIYGLVIGICLLSNHLVPNGLGWQQSMYGWGNGSIWNREMRGMEAACMGDYIRGSWLF